MEEKTPEPTIVDFLAGRTSVTPSVRITADQRLYFNYRLDKPSFDAETANVGAPTKLRDFRSASERKPDE